MDVYGVKSHHCLLIALVTLGAGGSVLIQEPWQLYLLWGVIIGAGSGGTSMIMAAAVVNRWFHERRGLALGISGAAFSSGQLMFTPILMNMNMHEGWRTSILCVVLLLGLVVLPMVIWLMVDNPTLRGLKPYGTNGNADTPLCPDSSPMRKAMAKPQFWLLAFSFGICGLTTSGLFQTHLIPHGIEHGFPEMTMATSFGLMGATDVVGTILSGWLCDRYGKRWPLAIYYLLRGVFIDSAALCRINRATDGIFCRLWSKLVINNPGNIGAHRRFVRQTKCRGCIRLDLLCPSGRCGDSVLWRRLPASYSGKLHPSLYILRSIRFCCNRACGLDSGIKCAK